MTDEPEHLKLVSPCVIDQDWDGSIFAELQASFTNPSLRYHAIGKYVFNSCYNSDIIAAAKISSVTERVTVMRIVTVKKMKVFDLMTGGDESGEYVNQTSVPVDQVDQGSNKKPTREEKVNAVKAKLEEYNDSNLQYEDVAMPEIDVVVYFTTECSSETGVHAKMKMKRVIRYHHLTRDYVDEKEHPPTQEYFLYSDQKNAYLSHCPNRYPDFQQLIYLDEIPTPFTNGNQTSSESDKKVVLYQEALERGVVVYLPEISSGGKPTLKKSSSEGSKICKDPIKRHAYNAISWSDQGAFTGDMTSICLRFLQHGKRWFDGKNINQDFEEAKSEKFGYLYDKTLSSDEESDDETDNES